MNQDAEQRTEKFKIGDQWVYRGNLSDTWLFFASRPDGSCQDGICEPVPFELRPYLEELAKVRFALSILYEQTADYIRINNLGDVHQNFSMRLAREALKQKP